MSVREKIEKLPRVERILVKDTLQQINQAMGCKNIQFMAMANHMVEITNKLYPKMDADIKKFIDDAYTALVKM